ncbi:MAG: hypothetical protein ACRC78_15770 [Planktothrix sp.]
MENNFPYFVMIAHRNPHYQLKIFTFSVRISTSILFFTGLYQGIVTFLAKNKILMPKLHISIIS